MANSLEEIISGIVKERFADAIIDSVKVEGDFDYDGERILRVTVVFESEIAKLDPSRLAGLTRHVRPKIEKRRDAGFPIFRFMSKRDSDRLTHEAA